MAKDNWKRIEDTMVVIQKVLGAEPFNHILLRLPLKGIPAADVLSERLSLGGRGLFRKSSITKKRALVRAYGLVSLLLDGKADVVVRQEMTDALANKADFVIQGDIKMVWRRYNKDIGLDEAASVKLVQHLVPRFKRNLLDFMKTYSVLPHGGSVAVPLTPQAQPDPAYYYSLVTMDDSNEKPRIQKVFLRQIKANEYTFKLIPSPRTKEVTAPDIYFLPWKSGYIIDLTIPQNAGPSIFFTAAINGCSVFVEGPDNSPTIYHAGIDLPWLDMTNKVNNYVSAAKNQDNAPLVWRELFFQRSPNTNRGNVQFGERNKTHYIKDGTMLNGKECTAQSSIVTQHITANWPNSHFDVIQAFPWGCIFGLRAPNGNWKFYLQENLTIIFASTAHNNPGTYGTSRVLRITQFYPRNANYAFTPAGRTNPPANLNTPEIIKMG